MMKPAGEFWGLFASRLRPHHATDCGLKNPTEASLHNKKQEIRNKKPPEIQGFTLIEIVLAIGILSFALVGILGLFPVALETARESKEETMMAQVAQSIEADIRRADGPEAQLMATGFNPADPSARRTLRLDASSELLLAFGPNGRPWTAQPGSAEFASGLRGPDYLAKVTCTFNPPDHPGLARIDISVESPAAAPETARKALHFTTLKRLP
jgi:prepilin-type N-terminal cleavage/methylation domain-containing protein